MNMPDKVIVGVRPKVSISVGGQVALLLHIRLTATWKGCDKVEVRERTRFVSWWGRTTTLPPFDDAVERILEATQGMLADILTGDSKFDQWEDLKEALEAAYNISNLWGEYELLPKDIIQQLLVYADRKVDGYG